MDADDIDGAAWHQATHRVLRMYLHLKLGNTAQAGSFWRVRGTEKGGS